MTKTVPILLAIVILMVCTNGMARPTAAQIKANEAKYLPMLDSTISCKWPEMDHRHYLGGQIYAESKWDPTARLKTDREEGVNFGQITVTAKFNNFEAFKALDKDLKTWKWDNRFDPVNGLIALVVYDRTLYQQTKLAATDQDRYAFMFSAYNGGMGGLLKDRRLCQGTKGCDSTKWFGHVEHTSYKAKSKVQGYGNSFFTINRTYVSNIMGPYGDRYIPYFWFDSYPPPSCNKVQ